MLQDNNCVYKSDHAKLCIKYSYTIDESVTFRMRIESYGFGGSHDFCMRKEQIKSILSDLYQMDTSFIGKCELADNDSDSYVVISFEANSLKISGQIGGSYNDNFMRFAFLADQTVIKLIGESLRKML